ncbi:SGNH/GDSL hydrolase family protein [Sorangium sp. So ce131]|uniref:SGNH/GDSL hydrolase family protein n=1 Tax=Sorangium sp. So ce131 TaxID=3133282 RepID=UPI003F5E376C
MSGKKHKELTHDEALQEVYRLTPQIIDIDDFLAPAKMRWLPYTMFFQHKNYRSKTINTDDLGFRLTTAHGKEHRVSDVHEEPVNLLVGSSTAMGTGSCSDAFTIASRLAHHRREVWLNFAARAYNSTQEIILFLMHMHRFKKINKVIILSGMNNFVLEGLPESLRSDHGQYYYSYEYIHYMSMYNEEQGRKKQSLMQRLSNAINDRSEPIFTDEGVDSATRIQRCADATARALAQWKALLAPHGASLDFVLQPLTTWTKTEFTPEEEDIIHATDSCPNNFWRLFGGILGREVYPRYRSALESACTGLGIPFYDLNEMIRASDFGKDYIFVDRMHLNDHGYDGVARLLDKQVLPPAGARS